MMGATSRLAHLGVSGPFSGLGPVSSHGTCSSSCRLVRVPMVLIFSTQELANDKYDLVDGEAEKKNSSSIRRRSVQPCMSY